MPIPDELLQLWNVLDNETVAVHAKWQMYKQLFASGQDRLDRIQKIAWQFFQVVELGIKHDVILALARMGDPEKNKFQTNAVLRRIIAVVKGLGADDLLARLQRLADQFGKESKNVRLWRNKLIAHNDESHLLGQYEYAVGNAAAPSLPLIDHKEIDELLEILAKFMNAVQAYFTEVTKEDGTTSRTVTAYHMFIHRDGVESLLFELKKAQRYDDLVEEKKIEPDNLLRDPRLRW